MGVGGFEKPERGPQIGSSPKIGETVDYSKLSPERKAELGDLEQLKAAPTTPEPQLSSEAAAHAQQGAEQLEALEQVLAKEERAEPVDETERRLSQMAEPTEEDKRAFLRCALGGAAYSKRYEMYGGMLMMELHDVKPSEEDLLFTALAAALDDGHIKTDEDWELMLDRMRLVVNVSLIRFAKNAPVRCSLGRSPLIEQIDARTRLFPTTALYRAALQTVRVFMRHMELMLDRALDPDFWELGGLDLLSEPTSAEPSDTTSARQ